MIDLVGGVKELRFNDVLWRNLNANGFGFYGPNRSFDHTPDILKASLDDD